MADHYLCPLGQVLDAVVPAGVRGRAGTREQVYLTGSDVHRRSADAAETAQQAGPCSADPGHVAASR